MDKRLLIVLYGEKDTGKTTCLINLVMELGVFITGNVNVKQTIKNTFFNTKNNRFNDGRFILVCHGIIIHICTGGDYWSVCRCNTDLFEGKYSSKMALYLIDNTGFHRLGNNDIKKYKKASTISITACRPNNENDGPYLAISNYVMKNPYRYKRMIWIKQESLGEVPLRVQELMLILQSYCQCSSANNMILKGFVCPEQ